MYSTEFHVQFLLNVAQSSKVVKESVGLVIGLGRVLNTLFYAFYLPAYRPKLPSLLEE